MTDDKWQEVVAYILNRLDSEAEFDADKEAFFTKFGLTESDDIEFMTRRDHPKPKYFHRKTVEHQSRLILVFSRLECPS
jgi:hypothetical protein